MLFRERTAAFLIDTLLCMIAYTLVCAAAIYDDYFLLTENLSKEYYFVTFILVIAVTIMYIGRDMIHGKSIGKRIMKIKAVNKNGSTPNVFQLILRDITIFIWPIEALLVLAGKEKMGDLIARTRIVQDKKM